MKEYKKNILFVSLVLGMILPGLTGKAIASDVCSRGISEPPFLSYGASSNLLMLFDNSGSMLDMAYIDAIGQCTDNTFDPNETYAGLFAPDKWYKWTDGVQPWKSGATYAAGDIVYSEGTFHQAVDASGDASTGYQIADDTEVDWAPLYTIPLWTQGDEYAPKSFVQYEGQLYYTELGGTALDPDSIDGISIGGDTGVAWEAVDSTWRDNEAYAAGDIVSGDGMLFRALVAVAAGTSVWDATKWEQLSEGYFEETAYTTVADAVTDLGGAEGVAYQQDNLYLHVVSAEDITAEPAADGSLPTVQSRVPVFAASGKLLNWATSSKFDIQKEILTGGKYNPDAEYLVSQHRGCSGRGFIKEVPVKQGVDDAVISLSIEGSTTENWIDTLDDTTRIIIWGISTTGFIGSDRQQACQDAIDSIVAGYDDGQGTTKQNITDCLDYGGTNNILAESNSAYNHSVHTCWQMVTFNDKQDPDPFQVPDDLGQITEVQNSCEHIYRLNIPPTAITPENSGYVCYGVYNENIADARSLATVAGDGSDRLGYVGRCWKLGDLPEDCLTVTCDPDVVTEDWEDPVGSKIWHRCLPDGLIYSCDDYNTGQDECKNGTNWKLVIADNNDGDAVVCDTTQTVDIGGWSEADPPGINTIEGCIQSGLWDYCQGITMPEVIDPSDQVLSTGATWGMIGALIDSGIATMFGTDHALTVMKGYIRQNTAPQGILHAVAQDLRIGAMAFNDNGANTECAAVDVNDNIVEYCPPDNKDGANIISPIKLGSSDSAVGGTHVENLVESINQVRATSWTPLAEAVYNAIGYYTQNTGMRLNDGDFQTDDDVMAGWQNDYYYAPGSYLMVNGSLYYTEEGGTSNDPGYDNDADPPDPPAFSDDAGVSWTPVNSYRGQWTNNETYNANDIVSFDNNGDTFADKLYQTVLGGVANLNDDAAMTAPPKDGPLYDKGVVWEFLIDPVINYCQGNYILIITEGASTADVNAQVAAFVASTNADNGNIPIIDTGEATADAVVASQCSDGLLGSTYVDDLTYFAQDENDQYAVYPASTGTLPETDYPFTEHPKNNITTYIVTAGAPRDNGTTDECNPAYLMDRAAANGGTIEAMGGEDPETLENNLLEIFNELRQRASAGSAASVISSARGGEGAIYQAIFWPELFRENAAGDEFTVEWAGDVHGLFLDSNGFVYEDTNGDRTLNPAEDFDGDGQLDCGEDLNCNGVLDGGEVDIDGDGELDPTEDVNGNGIFDISMDLNGDGSLQSEDIDGDGHFDRYFEDLNNNGSLDGNDFRIIVFFDNTPGVEKARACLNTSIIDTFGETCTNSKDMEQIHFLWSVNQWLSDYPDIPTLEPLTTRTNRSANAGSFNADSRERYIFTWNDVNKDGAVDNGEVVDFVATADGGSVDWGPLASDFDVEAGAEVDRIIRWIRGEDDFTDEDIDGDKMLDVGVDTDNNGTLDINCSEDLNCNGAWDAGEVDINGDGVLDVTEDKNGNGILDLPQRSRQTIMPDPGNLANTYATTWRLGDVIHSTPMTVASPAEGYHLIYNDFSYAQFLARWKNRRHIVYFGGNDGMLHAVNAGFYRESDNRFYLGYDYPNGTYNDSGPALGTEMWAYVPYNLHPHLKCLTDPHYAHKYFVDQRPRIFDVQIFQDEAAAEGCDTNGFSDAGCIHPNGWGTILVGGMRFGGTPIGAAELTDADPNDSRQFISSYFIFDITNPEEPPVLLGELTQTLGPDAFTGLPDPASPQYVDLGYSSVIPTMVIMKDKGLDETDPSDDINDWYLILGSGPRGPDGVKGISNQGTKISVLPLEWLVSNQPLRIPAVQPTGKLSGGTFAPPEAQITSFVSDLITVDFDINPSYEEYKGDAVYFGTVEGELDKDFNQGFSYYDDGTTYWNGGGHMYRLVMEPYSKADVGNYNDSDPTTGGHIVGQTGGEPVTEPDDWRVTTLLNLGSNRIWNGSEWQIVPQVAGHPMQPITSAASVGTDGYNFWIYFGTGRFFDANDKTDHEQQSYYGIKEPMDMVTDGTAIRRRLNWKEVEFFGSPTGHPGSKGLAKVDEILVGESQDIEEAPLICRDNSDIVNGGPAGTACLEQLEPPNFSHPFYTAADDNAYFEKMERYIAGTGRCLSNSCSPIRTCTDNTGTGYSPNNPNYKNNCTDGWRNDFWPYNNREKNVGQATLLGGLVTFTTYQPYSGVCQAEGTAYLYGVYYKTGTPWYENIFGEFGLTSTSHVKDKLSLGRGLATTPNLHVGAGGADGDGPKAFIQTSTGEIKEIKQDNLPIKNYGTGRTKWQEYRCP